MKYDYKKDEKEIYGKSKGIKVLELPKATYLTIEGEGNPNSEDFQKCVEALYSVSYALKMKVCKENNDYFEYVVYPLEGVWDLIDYKVGFNLDNLKYKIMIKQPKFVTSKNFDDALNIVKEKKDLPELSKLKLEHISEGKCVQMLHVGPFATESETFAIMDEYIEENGYVKTTKVHKEIYLSDMRRVSEDKYNTLLRYYIK